MTEFNKIFSGRERRQDLTLHASMRLFAREYFTESYTVYIPRVISCMFRKRTFFSHVHADVSVMHYVIRTALILYQVLDTAGHSVCVLYYINEHTMMLYVHFHILSFKLLLRFHLNSFTLQATNNILQRWLIFWVMKQILMKLGIEIRH
jgi:hypothetical protein